jgi:RNA polymerase sigma-70 factor (ECF subfamily)
MSGEEDDDLARAKRGDRLAFTALVRKHQRRVYATALHMMGNHGDADDVAQDVFLRAYRALPSFDGRSDLFTWLYRITVNTALNHIRTRKRADQIAQAGANETQAEGRPERLGAVDPDPRRSAEMTERMRRVIDSLCELSPTLRITLVLATVEGLPYRKIAELLEIPEGTVAWRINEARKQLKQRLEGEEVAGEEGEPAAGDGERGQP